MARRKRQPPKKPTSTEPKERAPEVRDLAEAAFEGNEALFFEILSRRLAEMQQAGWTEKETEHWAEGVCEILGIDWPRHD